MSSNDSCQGTQGKSFQLHPVLADNGREKRAIEEFNQEEQETTNMKRRRMSRRRFTPVRVDTSDNISSMMLIEEPHSALCVLSEFVNHLQRER